MSRIQDYLWRSSYKIRYHPLSLGNTGLWVLLFVLVFLFLPAIGSRTMKTLVSKIGVPLSIGAGLQLTLLRVEGPLAHLRIDSVDDECSQEASERDGDSASADTPTAPLIWGNRAGT